MIPDPSNPQVGDVMLNANGVEVTIGIVGTFHVAYSWVAIAGDTLIDFVSRDHIAKHWKPKRPEATPCMGVELVNGKRMAWHTDEETMRDEYPHAVRIGPARVVFVEDEQ